MSLVKRGERLTAEQLNEFLLEIYALINKMTPDQYVVTTGQFLEYDSVNDIYNQVYNRFSEQVIISDDLIPLVQKYYDDFYDLWLRFREQ